MKLIKRMWWKLNHKRATRGQAAPPLNMKYLGVHVATATGKAQRSFQ